MSDPRKRSEQVIEAYKRHKLARSAWQRIQRLLRGFEAERAADRSLARIGIVLLLAVIGLVYLYWASAERVTLN